MARIITLIAIAAYFYLSKQMLTNKGGGADIAFAVAFIFLLLMHFLIIGIIILVKRRNKTGNERSYIDSIWIVIISFLLFIVIMVVGGDQFVRAIAPLP